MAAARNPRFIYTGLALGALAGAFFFGMGAMASKSNDPASLMQTVGGVAGVAGAIGVLLVALGLIGKRF